MRKQIIIGLMLLTSMVLGLVVARSQTVNQVVQLDSDNYQIQYSDGTSTVFSNSQVSTNINACQNLINKYSAVLNEINQGNEVSQAQYQTAIQSVQTSQPALGASTAQPVVNGT